MLPVLLPNVQGLAINGREFVPVLVIIPVQTGMTGVLAKNNSTGITVCHEDVELIPLTMRLAVIVVPVVVGVADRVETEQMDAGGGIAMSPGVVIRAGARMNSSVRQIPHALFRFKCVVIRLLNQGNLLPDLSLG